MLKGKNNKNLFSLFWSEAIALKYKVQVKLCQCTFAVGRNRQRENIQPRNGRVFASGAATIDKEGFGVGEDVGVRVGSEGGVGLRWKKVRKKEEQCGKWNEMRTSWAEEATAQSDSLSSGRPVCHGSLRLMDTFSACQGRLQRKVLLVRTVGRWEMCVWGVESGRRNRLAQVETRARRIAMIHS